MTAPPVRKRRRLDRLEDIKMADLPSAGLLPTTDLRPIVLETGKESYLLSPNILPSPSSGGPCRVYDIALILEAEEVVVVEEQPNEVEEVMDKTQEELTPVKGIASKDDFVIDEADVGNESIASSSENFPVEQSVSLNEMPPEQLKLSTSPVHSPEPTSRADEDGLQPSSPLPAEHDKTPAVVAYEELEKLEKPQFALQVLQCNLGQNMFRFADDGVYVLDASGSGDGMETEWVIQVKNWKWAPRYSKDRLA